MASIASLLVLVDGNTTGLSSALSKGAASVKAFGVSTTASSAEAGKGISKFGLIAGVVAIAAGAAILKFSADAIKSYEDHEKALLLLQNALDNSPAIVNKSTKAYEEQATALQNLTGYQDEEILKADAVIAKFGLTAAEIEDLNPLILDYARITGTDAATAAGNLGKALLGNTRALKTIGVEYKATGDRTTDVAVLTEALRGKVEGVAAAYGGTLPGQMAIFRAKVDDVKEALGARLIPVMQNLMDLLTAMLPLIGFVADAIGLLAGAASAAVNPIGAFHQAGQDWNAMMQLMLDNLGKYGPAVDHMIMANVSAADVLAHQYAPAVQEAADRLDSATNASDTWIGSVNIAAGLALPAATAATEGLTAAVRDSITATLAATDATFSIIDALNQDTSAAQELIGAQNHLNQLVDAGKTSGDAYQQALDDVSAATLASARAHAGLLGAVADLQAKFEDGSMSRRQTIADLRDMADSAGLTKAQTALLVGELKAGIAALKDWNATPFADKTAIVKVLSVFGGDTSIPGFAGGGTMESSGLAVVGEKGPELVYLPGGTRISPDVPATASLSAVSGVSGNGGLDEDRLALKIAQAIEGRPFVVEPVMVREEFDRSAGKYISKTGAGRRSL